MKNSVKKTRWHSWKSGALCKGCTLCVEGKKLVLFITGICGQRCFYCPISEQKFGSDVVFANEWKITNPENPKELIEEAKLTNAEGAGITGGDPLTKVDRCCQYIELLKSEFGKNFHIHLYTPLQLVDKDKLQKLFSAGLDEIRFHPDLDNDKLWGRILLGKLFSWSVGIEIPAVPGYENKTKRLIDFVANTVDFINFNELELSDTDAKHYALSKLGFKPKDDISYGVKGSKKLALQMAKYAESKNLRAHFCTAQLKDSVQVKKRIQRRAENVALPFDKITEEGTLIRGCVYLVDLKPSVGYRTQLKSVDRQKFVEKLLNAKKELTQLGIKESEIFVDENKLRFIVSQTAIKKYSYALKKKGFAPAIVEEYPTADAIELDVVFI